MTLQETCKAKAKALGVTYQEIADATNIPLQTVRNFFSAASKAPSIFTVAPICKFLGVSLDEFFCITVRFTMSEKLLNAQNDTLKTHEKELEKHLASNDKTIHIMWKGVKTRNRIIAALLVLLFLSTAYAVYLDFNCIQIGFWRG